MAALKKILYSKSLYVKISLLELFSIREITRLSIVCLLLNPLQVVSQYTEYEGKLIPNDFKIHTHNTINDFLKHMDDTLRFETFTKIKQDFVVNKGCGEYGANQNRITITSGKHGGFLCAWNDERAGDQQVDAQLFDSLGNRIGSVIHVSDGNANWNSEPHIVFNEFTNEYIVFWAGSGYNILFQRISADGEKINQNITANKYFRTNTNNPSAAIDSSGNIIVTWTADVTCCSNSVPYCRIFDKQGTAITDDWSLIGSRNDRLSSQGWNDRIATDSLGRSIIVWSSHIEGKSRIVFQSVDLTGNLYDLPIIVSDPDDSNNHYFPTITSTNDGHFLIIWESDDGVMGRIFSADSGFMTPQFTIAYHPNYWMTYSVSSDKHNKFFVTWSAEKPYGLVISTHGQFSDPPKHLSFSSPIKWWSHPSLSKSISNRLFLVYYGYIRSQQDAMLQAFDSYFNPIGSSVKVADDGCGAAQTNPIVKFNKSGSSLVVWGDERNGYHQLFGQVLDNEGNQVMENIQISLEDTMKWVTDPSIIANSDGDFIVTFAAGDFLFRNLILQKISASGVSLGTNKWITQGHNYSSSQIKNIMQENSAGELFLCWYTSGHSPLYTQRFSKDLSPLRNPLSITVSTILEPKSIHGVSANNQFNILVMWTDYNYQTYTYGKVIKAMVLNEDGTIVRDTFIVRNIMNDRSLNLSECRIDDKNNLLFVWSEYNNGYEYKLYMKRFYDNSEYSRIDSFSLSNINSRIQIVKFENEKAFVAWAYDKIYSIFLNDVKFEFTPVLLHKLDSLVYSFGDLNNAFSADIFDDKLLLSYESSQIRDFGYEIFANIQQFNQFNFDLESESTEYISAVYPNPGNQTVTLRYLINQPTSVQISVYNILGQKIADIEKGIKLRGKYDVQFQTKNLASGVYFFHYRGVKSVSKKFVVLK